MLKRLKFRLSFLGFYAVTIAVGLLTIANKTLTIGNDSFELFMKIVLIYVLFVLSKNFLIISISFWYDVWKKSHLSSCVVPRNLPLVSIIVPAWNEEVGIINTLNSLMRQSYKNIEILVVNDGSTDRTSQVVAEYIKRHTQKKVPIQIKLINQANKGKAAALNTGVSAVQGEYVLTIDADSLAARQTVEHFVRMMHDPTVDGAVGNIQIAQTNYMLGVMQWIEYKFTFFLKRSESILGTLYVVGGAAAMYRRSVINEIGLFNSSSLTEDLDFALRMLKRGKRIIYIDDALVLTEGARDLSGLLRQRLRWRLGKLKAFYLYRGMFFSRSAKINKNLSFVGLPWALFSEAMVLIEPLLFISFIYYIFISNAYSYLFTVVICTSIMVLYVSILDPRRRWRALYLAPTMWIVFLMNAAVELLASIASIYSVVTEKDVKWQTWQRKGILSDRHSQSSPVQQTQTKKTLHFLFKVVNRFIGWIIILYFAFLLGFFFYLLYGGFQNESSKFLVASLYILGTDTILLLLHVYRRPIRHRHLEMDVSKLSIIIICYNGEKIIGETLRQAMQKVPASQILVVSDCSNDKTAQVAKSYGVRVFINRKNMNKALSINLAAKHINTPYVLILDDDTHIGKTIIPTNLMDEGFNAVAFNVMPEKRAGLCNAFQQFEYRKAMYLGKSLRSKVGAIGNVSGAIGLFRTEDIQRQANLHTGQFGGEDQQRTVLVQLLQSEGEKGIAYVDSLVLTEPPATFRVLFRQRAYKWGMAVHENFFLFIKLMMRPQVHPLLKFERAYLIFVFLSDPIRIVLTPLIFMNLEYLPVFYAMYLVVELIGWAKTGYEDPWYVVILAPIYSMFRNIARFIAYFYWLKVKYDYIFKNRYHRLISDRSLRLEYAIIIVVMVLVCSLALMGVKDDYSELLQLIGAAL